RDVTDLESENVFRRAVSLPGIMKDHRSRPKPPPLPHRAPDDAAVARSKVTLSTSYVGDLADQRDLVLSCVFNRFDVMVPPAECDASQYPELVGLKKKLQIASVKTTKSAGKSGLAEQTEFWTQEAIEYLGFNRLDVARPDMLLQRLIKKGALRPTKIGRRNVFKKADLDRVREKGDQVRRRGRPRKDET
ncbi:MAG: helix-turn-helix domain-containing protein, partial [Phycisphaerae bacterium]|nr:helix-turn-helix domain-containing protein [Phycisphaerae bacterium]